MKLLAFESSAKAAGVAVLDDGRLLAEYFQNSGQTHSRTLMQMAEDLLDNCDLTPQDIGACAVADGPGSFTGVRIGIGIAQGLALGAELPMIGVSTLATMAQGAWRKTGATRVLAAIDARMGEVYWAEYQRDEQGVWHGEETEAVLKPDAVAERLAQLSGEWATVGTGWQAWPDLAKASGLTLSSGEIELPAAEDMLPLACYLLAAGKTVAVEKAEPVYLRNEVAWKKLPGRE